MKEEIDKRTAALGKRISPGQLFFSGLFFYFVCFQIPVILLHHIDKILRVW